MIENIQLNDVATYRGKHEVGPFERVNYVFGANGAGKTTLARALGATSTRVDVKRALSAGPQLDTLVYNRDFVRRNFGEDPVPGVFTLGEGVLETKAALEENRKQRAGKLEVISRLAAELAPRKLEEGEQPREHGAPSTRLEAWAEHFRERAWKRSEVPRAKFPFAFEGFTKSREKLAARVREISGLAGDRSPQTSLTSLEERARVLAHAAGGTVASLPSIDRPAAASIEQSDLPGKPLVGSKAVDLAALVARVDCGAWVEAGRAHWEKSAPTCPFCQGTAPEGFGARLAILFDKTFAEQKLKLAALRDAYLAEIASLRRISTIEVSPAIVFDRAPLAASWARVFSVMEANREALDAKLRDPGHVVTLRASADALTEVGAIWEDIQRKIARHNALVGDVASSRRLLVADIWDHLSLDDLRSDVEDVRKAEASIRAKQSGIEQKLTAAKADLAKLDGERRALEGQVTTIRKTADSANETLQKLGIKSFTFVVADGDVGYRLARADGTFAADTLSEGERTFATVLYFYLSVLGQDPAGSRTTARIVVVDDPVSSLEGDLLFAVCGLLRDLATRAREAREPVAQLFVLTHNPWFFKELVFHQMNNKQPRGAEAFWVVRKRDEQSGITRYAANPIGTSYDLLWEQALSESNDSMCANALRRIIEHYFSFVGGLALGDLIGRLQGSDAVLARSLMSSLHDGSHAAPDDLHAPVSDATPLLRVFETVFCESGHREHFEMMRGRTTAALQMRRSSASAHAGTERGQ